MQQVSCTIPRCQCVSDILGEEFVPQEIILPGPSFRPVDTVADDWAAQLLSQVHPDLVRTTRFQLHVQRRDAILGQRVR